MSNWPLAQALWDIRWEIIASISAVYLAYQLLLFVLCLRFFYKRWRGDPDFQ
jgi:hypothetical protein